MGWKRNIETNVGGVRNVFLRLLVMLVCMCDVHACMLLAVMPGVLLSVLRRMFYSPLQPMPALGGSLCATGFVATLARPSTPCSTSRVQSCDLTRTAASRAQ